MRTFRCECGATTFFQNDRCLSCSRELGFIPRAGLLSALEPLPDGTYAALAVSHAPHKKCQNNAAEGVCNWMLGVDEMETYCQACRLNNVIPDLSQPENRERWASVERAKRQLVYSLNRLGLRIVPKSVDPDHGVAFDIMQTTPTVHVMTGHADGLITLDISEADPVARERMRVAMNERYRTVLGHFRHEIGHYYWDIFFGGQGHGDIDKFRALFGDERADYSAALAAHYDNGARVDWPSAFVSAYASSHPWEDWAECFAHYLHIMDTLETARHFGLTGDEPMNMRVRDKNEFEDLMLRWMELTIALNALNRSMGQPDAYPFTLSAPAREKLRFVHASILDARGAHEALSKVA